MNQELATGDEDLARYGWAPGIYMGQKCACGSEFGQADRKAWRCKPCALRARDEAVQAWPSGCHDAGSCARHRTCTYHCRHAWRGAALGEQIDAARAATLHSDPLAPTGPAPRGTTVFHGKPIDQMTREEAIAALRTALAGWGEADQRTTETHAFYRDLIARRFAAQSETNANQDRNDE